MTNFFRRIFCRNHVEKLVDMEGGMHDASAWITQLTFHYECSNCGAKKSRNIIDESIRSVALDPKSFGLSVDDIKRVLVPTLLWGDRNTDARKKVASKVLAMSNYDNIKDEIILNLL
jgi:hypothetical protein